MAPRALATADVTGASYDNVVCGGGWGRHTNLLSHKQHFRWKKKSPFTSLMDGVLIIIMTFILFLINSFSADSSFSVVCRIRGSRSISAFIFYFYFGQFSYDCLIFFFISIWCYVSFLLSCIIYFFRLFLRRSTGAYKGFSSTFLMSCVRRFHVQELCTVCERVVSFENILNLTMQPWKRRKPFVIPVFPGIKTTFTWK